MQCNDLNYNHIMPFHKPHLQVDIMVQVTTPHPPHLRRGSISSVARTSSTTPLRLSPSLRLNSLCRANVCTKRIRNDGTVFVQQGGGRYAREGSAVLGYAPCSGEAVCCNESCPTT